MQRHKLTLAWLFPLHSLVTQEINTLPNLLRKLSVDREDIIVGVYTTADPNTLPPPRRELGVREGRKEAGHLDNRLVSRKSIQRPGSDVAVRCAMNAGKGKLVRGEEGYISRAQPMFKQRRRLYDVMQQGKHTARNHVNSLLNLYQLPTPGKGEPQSDRTFVELGTHWANLGQEPNITKVTNTCE